MKTIILFWNPEVSSFTTDDYQKALEKMGYAEMNWSVYEHEKTHFGDRFFMVRCGEANAGICMSGYIVSEPYQDEDWAGEDRVVYYADIEPDCVINPTSLPILSSEELMREIPGFDWLGGHSGRVLDGVAAEKLEALWKTFTDQHAAMFGIRADKQEVDLEAYREQNKEVIVLTIGEEGMVLAENSHYRLKAKARTVAEAVEKMVEAIGKRTDCDFDYRIDFDYMDEDDMALYGKAADLAFALFEDRKDRLGKPYVAHLVRVAKDFFGNAEKRIVALLQDMLSLKLATPTGLRKMGFGQEIVDAIVALTQEEGETSEDYLRRVGENVTAREVMMASLEDELNFYRYEEIGTDDAAYINRQLKAWRYLDNYNTNDNEEEEDDE